MNDGWEHGTAWHTMLQETNAGQFMVALPQTTHEGDVMVYRMPYHDFLWAMVDGRARVRACGFVAFAVGATAIVEAELAMADTDGPHGHDAS